MKREKGIMDLFVGKTITSYQLANDCRDPDGITITFSDGSFLFLEAVLDIGEPALAISSLTPKEPT